MVAFAPGSTVARDLTNTVAGESLVVKGVAVDHAGVGTVVALGGVSTSAPGTVASVDSSGNLVAKAASDALYTVSGRYAGKSYSASFAVTSGDNRRSVTGVVRTAAGLGVAGATLKFLGASGTETVATATVGADGTYQANVPVTATRFSLDVASLNDVNGKPLYYNTYSFGTDTSGDALYYITGTSCAAPLPSGAALGDVVFFPVASGVIPPAPTGCTNNP